MRTPSIIAPDSPIASLLSRGATDPAALAALAEVESPALRSWLARVLRDGELAEEAVQEAWVGLLRGGWAFAPRTADGDGDARAWLRQVALRTALNLRRSRRNAQHWHRAAMFRPASAPDPLEILEARDLTEVVDVCLEQLPPVQRQAVVLRFRQGLDFRAIGAVQGCTALTARVRAWRGLRRLRQGLLLLGLVLVRGESLAAMGGMDGRSSPSMGHPGSAPPRPGGPGPWLARSLFRRWKPVAVGIVAVGAFIWSTWAESPAEMPSLSSPWLVREPLSVVLTESRISNQRSDGDRTQPPRQILVRAQIVRWSAPCPWAADRVQVLDRTAGSRVLSDLAQGREGYEIVGQPKLLLLSGQSGSLEMGSEVTFIAGHRRREDLVEPCRETLQCGSRLEVCCQAWGNEVLFDQVFNRERNLLGMTPRQSSSMGSGNAPGNLNWEEPRIREICAIPLPADGIRLRPGEVLLVPPGSARDLLVTPGSVLREAVSPAEGSWLLLRADQVPPGDAPVAAPVGRS